VPADADEDAPGISGAFMTGFALMRMPHACTRAHDDGTANALDLLIMEVERERGPGPVVALPGPAHWHGVGDAKCFCLLAIVQWSAHIHKPTGYEISPTFTRMRFAYPTSCYVLSGKRTCIVKD
jgi:hypothetical protein